MLKEWFWIIEGADAFDHSFRGCQHRVGMQIFISIIFSSLEGIFEECFLMIGGVEHIASSEALFPLMRRNYL